MNNNSTENKFKPNRKLHEGDTHTENTSLNYITTTSDKLNIFANKFSDGVNARVAWITPLSLFITLVVTLITAEFKKVWLVEAHIWENLFQISAFVAFIFTVITLIKCTRHWRNGSTEKFINDIRGIED